MRRNLINSFRPPSDKFGKNSSTGSEDNTRKRCYADADTDADGIPQEPICAPLSSIGGGVDNTPSEVLDVLSNLKLHRAMLEFD